MTKLGLFIAALSLSFTMSNAQSYDGPESIEFDPNDGNYFVANANGGTMVKLTPGGTLTSFAIGITLPTGPHGLELVGDTLYACDGSTLKMINRTTGTLIASIAMGATFLNGITHKDNNLYITDFSAKKIHRFNMITRQHNIFCSTISSKTPNGIIYDFISDRLVYCCWGASSPVHAISLADSTVTSIGATTLSNVDGITMNCSGDFYLASWGQNRVTRFNHTFTQTNNFLLTLSSPADIYYNLDQDTLYAPNSGNNTVSKKADASCTIGLTDHFENNSYPVLYPNPAGNVIHFKKEELIETTECFIYDLQAKLMKKNVLSLSNADIDISDLKAGMYLVMLRSATKHNTFKLIKE